MRLSAIALILLSLNAQAQFEDFDNILAPSTLTPKVGIICNAQVMFGETDLVIDIKNGVATQVVGNNKYTYRIDSFSFEKIKNQDKAVKVRLTGGLDSVIDTVSGKESKVKEKKGSFVFSSYLPTKDGKKFKADSFELSSNVKFESGSAFNISSKTTNSTNCKLVKGGSFIKDLNSNSSIKYAGEYKKPEVNDSGRDTKKEVESAGSTGTSDKKATTTNQ